MKSNWIRTTALLAALLVMVVPAPMAEGEHTNPAPVSNTTSINAENLMMRNPAAIYCMDIMGYEYNLVDGLRGEQAGICVLPNGKECNQWDFYAGTCGQSYSYCTQQGYRIETRSDGKDPFASEYAVCVSSKGQVLGSTAQLSDLHTSVTNCGSEVCPEMITDQDAELREGRATPSDSNRLDTPSVPSSFDWRNYQGYNWLTGVKDQGGCGSCWAFAAVGVAEAHHNIIFFNPNLDLDLAEQDLVSCSSAGSCSGGSTSSALQYIRDGGIVDEACLPYTASDSICNKCSNWQNRLTYVDEVYSFVPNQSAIKQSVVNYGPTYAYMGIGGDYGGYFDGSSVYRCSNDSQNGNSGINHAVVIVGYNDTGSYWIVRNSWGSGWNGDGYFKVGYNECNIDSTYAGYAYVIPPITSHSFSGTEGNNGWYLSDVMVTLTINEAVTWTRYRIDGGGWRTYSTPFLMNNDGIHTLEYYSRDIFGGEENIKSTTVKIDKTAPNNPTTANSGCGAQNGVWQNTCNDPNFTWSGATDATSGVAGYQVYWGPDPNGTAAFWSTSPGYNPPAVSTGTYYLRVRTKDRAGNWSNWKTLYTFRYDNAPPSGSFSFSGGELSYTINTLLDLNGTDVGSGVSKVRLSNNGADWTEKEYTQQVNWTIPANDGQRHTVYLRFVDAASNVSPIYQQQICLDLTPPRPSSDSYRLWPAGSIAGGGYASASYRLHHTEGQPFARNPQIGSNYRLHSGFQATWPSSPGAELFTADGCAATSGGLMYLPIIIKNQ